MVCLSALELRAHTVPTITVEAEFTAGREVTLRVNLDPRLFLSTQPTSLPPVPASWWFEQDEAARAASRAAATDYVGRTIRFEAGDSRVDARWKVSPIDSASAFPLGPNSAEVHLLAEYRGPVPDVAGDFKVTLDAGASVGLILLNSLEGKAERHPQAIFPGESSRGFKLPERSGSGAMAAGAGKAAAPAGNDRGPMAAGRVPARHFPGDHLLVALVLAVVLGGRLAAGIGMVALFISAHGIAAVLVAGGWLPESAGWMCVPGWVAVGAGIFLVHRRRWFRAGACFAVAGFCHGLDLPHLHPSSPDQWAIVRDAALLGAAQIGVLLAARWTASLAARWRRRKSAGMAAC